MREAEQGSDRASVDSVPMSESSNRTPGLGWLILPPPSLISASESARHVRDDSDTRVRPRPVRPGRAGKLHAPHGPEPVVQQGPEWTAGRPQCWSHDSEAEQAGPQPEFRCGRPETRSLDDGRGCTCDSVKVERTVRDHGRRSRTIAQESASGLVWHEPQRQTKPEAGAT